MPGIAESLVRAKARPVHQVTVSVLAFVPEPPLAGGSSVFAPDSSFRAVPTDLFALFPEARSGVALLWVSCLEWARFPVALLDRPAQVLAAVLTAAFVPGQRSFP